MPVERKGDPEPLGLRASAKHRALFMACDRLEHFLLDQFPRAGIRSAAYDNRLLIWTTVMRALKTFDALLNLADQGYGEQATILSRTVFEDAVVAWWCSLHSGEDLVERMVRHEQSVALRVQMVDGGRAEYEALAAMQFLDEETAARIADEHEVDRRLATRHWTGQTVKKMTEDVAPELEPADRDVLDRLIGASYLLSNLVVHHSSYSGGAPFKETTTIHGLDHHLLSRRPSDTFVHDALVMGYHSLSLLTRLVVRPERQLELTELLVTDRPLCVLVRTKASRNEPCPCGSGRKYKRCHGQD